jgi:hypothetical protein
MTSTTVNGHPHPARLPSGLYVPDPESTGPLPAVALPAQPAGEGAAAESPVPAPPTQGPAPAPAPPVSHQPAVQQGAEPEPEPTAPVMPRFPARRVIHVVYWLTIVGAGAGQIVAFGNLFGGQWWSWMGAAIIGAAIEAVIVSTVDTGLHNRARGCARGQYMPFMLIAAAATGLASGMNTWHWFGYEPKMGIFFGSLVLMGFALHLAHGCVEGTIYREQLASYREELEEYRAERRRQRRPRQRSQQPEQMSRPPGGNTDSGHPASSKRTGTSGQSTSQPAGRPDRDTVLEIARTAGVTSRAGLQRAITQAGYAPLPESTLKSRWREIRDG